ncbi:MAG: PHB depolymerase family esterase [Polyangiaceae bacterium]
MKRRAFAFMLLATSCGTDGVADSSSSSSSTGTGGAGGAATVLTVNGRSTEVHLPPGYDGKTPAPLLVMLHGYSVTAYLEELYLALQGPANDRGMIYVAPDGTPDQQGRQFWNATDACCNFYGSTVDDSGWLTALIDAISAKYNVDPKRVYLFGHSNGGFMAYRMACEHADRIAAIGSLAGAMWLDPTVCKPSAPVSVLQSHGTEDPEILYAGAPDGTGGAGPYPSAKQTVLDWAALDGCAPTPVNAPAQDFVPTIAGAETAIEDYAQGCQKGTAVTLWSIQGGAHIPDVGDAYRKAVLDFLLAHPKQD